MKTMAEVLEAHGWQGMSRAACYCGWGIPEGYYPRGTVQAHAAHQQDTLTAAGFGVVADAKREALEDAAQAWWMRDDVQDRFGAWNWLINRAAAVRGEG